jgi:hypothetical protein
MKNKSIFPSDFEFALNDTNTFDIFNGRKGYMKRAFYGSKKNIIDFWYENPYYGKVDQHGDASFISETNLKQLSADETLFAADFVVDAFNDFVSYYKELRLRGKLETEKSNLINLNPIKSWESINILHHEQTDIIYHFFVSNYLLVNKREEKVLSIKNFLDFFMKFYRTYFTRSIPLTRSGFIYSKFCPLTASGLVIELGDEDHGDDQTKNHKFLSDKNFEMYKMSAKNFGFMIDKNAPWRIVADVKSPIMQKYMTKYGVQEKPGTVSDLYEIYYYQAASVDIPILRRSLLHMYNSFISAYPFAVSHETREDLGDRRPIEEESYNRQYGDLFWIKVYTEIRALETGLDWSEQKLNKEVKYALELYNNLDFQSALSYINSKVRPKMRLVKSNVCIPKQK